MLTGKALFNTLLQELDDMGLPGMSATLDEMYRSPKFIELDPLAAIAALVEPEYRKKVNKRIETRPWALTLISMRGYELDGKRIKTINAVNTARKQAIANGMSQEEAMATITDETVG